FRDRSSPTVRTRQSTRCRRGDSEGGETRAPVQGISRDAGQPRARYTLCNRGARRRPQWHRMSDTRPCGGANAVSPVLLCLIERGIGARDDAVRGVVTCDDFGDAKARGDNQHLVVPADWALLEILPQHLRNATSACQRRVRQQDEKLFATITTLCIAAAKNRL